MTFAIFMFILTSILDSWNCGFDVKCSKLSFVINRRAYFMSGASAISADTRAGGMTNACTNIRAELLIAFMFSLIPIFVTFGNLTQTTHYIMASIFCILGAFMITLKTSPNLGLQAHAFITENTALVSLAAFLVVRIYFDFLS